MGEDEIIRRRICCFGWVQGVGFRWRARHAASRFGVVGFARNEDDGSVTLELQGTETQIDRVIQAVEQGAYIRIMHMESRRVPVDPDARSFHTE